MPIFLIIKGHSHRWVAVVSWLNYLILAIDLWGSSTQYQVKCTVELLLHLSTLLHMRSVWKQTGLGVLCELWVRNKQIVLSSNMISWKYITAILAFCNIAFFFFTCFYLHLFFQIIQLQALRNEQWTPSNE